MSDKNLGPIQTILSILDERDINIVEVVIGILFSSFCICLAVLIFLGTIRVIMWMF